MDGERNGSNGSRAPRPGDSGDRPSQGSEPRLELSYPTSWSYTVIAEAEGPLRAAVAAAVGELEHELRASRRSSKGRYLSFQLAVVVPDEGERRRIFRVLHEHRDIRYVL